MARWSLRLALVVGLLVACSPVAGPGPSASASPSAFAGGTVRIVTHGGQDFDNTTRSYWFDQLKAKGITVTVVVAASPDTALRAVVSGAADVSANTSITPLINLVQQSTTDAKFIAASAWATDYLIVSQSSLAAVADLAGKTMGILPGSANDLVSRQCLANAGFDHSKLTAANIGSTSAIVAALLAGRIDAGPVHFADGYAAIQKSNGALKILLECGKSIPNYPQTGMIATGAWLRSNQQLAQIIVDTYVDASRWANTNKAEYISRSAVWAPDMPAELRVPSYDALKSYKFWPANGGIDQASLEAYISVAAATGAVKGNFPTTEKWVDQTFVNDYLKRRGSQ